MNKSFRIWVTLGVATVFAVAALAAYPRRQPTFEIYGSDVLSTTASDDIVGAARHDVHKSLANWTTDAHGQRHDPSYKESGRGWSHTTKPGDTPVNVVGRGTTEFTDASGNHIVIEVISGKDRPTLVFFSPLNDKDAATLINAFAASLQKQGVRPVLHQ
ncbi:hypothetical protein [Prosthecobacter sp.]|uniref:hypothetical protein n=1 Tax=Prosthecobacter sp. TaxID=1965333 RepID=UPI003783A223